MIRRSGRFTQPRLGVSSTIPLLVSSGPGAPTPMPMISAPGTSRLVCSMVRLASAMSRSRTSFSPASAWVGSCPGHAGPSRLRQRCRRPGWCLRCQSRERIARASSEPTLRATPQPWTPTAPAYTGGGPGGRPGGHDWSRDDRPDRRDPTPGLPPCGGRIQTRGRWARTGPRPGFLPPWPGAAAPSRWSPEPPRAGSGPRSAGE